MNSAYFAPFANHLWQSTLFAGVAGLLTLALRNNHARVRHWVWLAASCKFLIPLAVLVALGGHIRWRPAPETTQSTLFVVMDGVSQPFTAPAVSSQLLAAAPHATNWLPAILWGIWVCGFLGITWAWWVRWRRIRTAVRAGSPVQGATPIAAMYSPTLLEPGVFGVFRPVLLLPEGIFERLTPGQLQAVIAHELCHVRHWDNLIAATHMLVEAVFWFHPLVWWIGKRMVEERERACDEEVLRLGSAPGVYAEGILNVCKLYVESPLVCVSGVTGSNLKKRITAIMRNRVVPRLSFAKKVVMAVAGTAALMGPIVAGMMNVPAIRAQSSSTVQAPAPHTPTFEVASVKPVEVSDARFAQARDSVRSMLPMGGLTIRGRRLEMRGYTLEQLIAAAFRIRTRQLVGPGWLSDKRFDVEAIIPSDAPADQANEMLQTLLQERFGLRAHRTTRQQAGYFLTVGKGGPSLNVSSPDPSGGPMPHGVESLAARIRKPGPPGSSHHELKRHSMEGLAETLAVLLQSPVEDRTELKENYDVVLDIPPPLDPGDRDPQPRVLDAVKKLGLSLKAGKVTLQVLVVDSIKKAPSLN